MKLGKTIKLIRDIWLILGITVFLFVLLESCLSIAFLVKDSFFPLASQIPDHRFKADTYDNASWVPNYYKERYESGILRWKPYVYWRRRPYNGDYINVNADGIRLTPIEDTGTEPDSGGPKIFMFGGSTMWGVGARDEFTIPAVLARELRDRGINAEVINFGESGNVFTQEVIELLLQLQKENIPDIVIFYDGVNDTFSAHQQGVAGSPQNEPNRVKEFNLSKPGRLKDLREMVVKDTLKRLSTIRFLKRVRGMLGLQDRAGLVLKAEQDGIKNTANNEDLARKVTAVYENNMKLVKSLAVSYGFKPLFYWQPTIFQKNILTKYERHEYDKRQNLKNFFVKTDSFIQKNSIRWHDDYAFHDLSAIFSDIQEPLYIDWWHLGERGNIILAGRMIKDVLPLIQYTGPPIKSYGGGDMHWKELN